MNILALDSTAKTATAAVLDNEKLLGIYTVNTENTHSETLLPMIKSLLCSLGLDVKAIDAFAVSNGPGSFTGVRIGAATIKGLAFGTGKICVGVSTIEALALNLDGFKGIVCPVMNARRGQVYTGLFENGNRIIEDCCMELDELVSIIEKRIVLADGCENVYFTGDGYELCAERNVKGFKSTPELLLYQNAYNVGRLAFRKIINGEKSKDIGLFIEYLRKPQAEREREKLLKSGAGQT